MKYFCISSFVLFLFVMTFVFPGYAVSQDRLTILRAGDWEPYHYMENNNLQGNLIQLIRKASDISGIDVEFKTISNWNRCLQMMKLGMADAFFPIFKTKEREEYMIFHENGILDYEKDYFVTSAKMTIQYSGDLKALNDYKIGVIKGYFYGEKFENAGSLQKIPARNEIKLIELLFADNRYDLIVGDKKVISSIASKKNVLSQLKFLEPPLMDEPLYMSFNKKLDPIQLKRFTDALQKARQLIQADE